MGFFNMDDYILIKVPLDVWNKNRHNIYDWLMTLPDDDYEYCKEHYGTLTDTRGMYFRHEEDIIAFKLMFGL